MRNNFFRAVVSGFALCVTCISVAQPQPIPVHKKVMVGDGIAKFVPYGYDAKSNPSFAIEKEPRERGKLESQWSLEPCFLTENGKTSAYVDIPSGTSLYGGGEVTGPLLRNGMTIKLWNTDSGAYSVENGIRLYQSHPWIMGVREDGTSFGVLFDTTWKGELSSLDNRIEIRTEGAPFRVFIIDRKSPQDVITGLSELTGRMPMVPLWTLGYHQCRFSYYPDSRVREVADTFREKRIPCDVMWMDIDYMDGFRIFTFDKNRFPDPHSLNDYLHSQGFHSVWMIDPGAKVDSSYFVYNSGAKKGVFVQSADGSEFHGEAWPGKTAFPDYTMPKTNRWWSKLYKDFIATGIDGVWNDVNEPYVGDQEHKTMPYDNIHRGGGKLPQGPHLQYHNVYGMLMVKASREGILAAAPEKRPFVLTRANYIGGQRYAATWTGDNAATWEHLKMSVPMSLTLGLSGQPMSGADIGGFLFNTDAELFGHWMGLGVFYPFARGHACAGTNDKEPWAFNKEVEDASRKAIEKRYRLLPYMYTLLHEASESGLPVMRPLFFADPEDMSLRNEQEAFTLGDDLLIIPSYSENPSLPKGIWRSFELLEGCDTDKYQAEMRIRGGAIIPCGKVVQNTTEKILDPLTLYVSLNENGEAEGELYQDAGDGWGFKKGEYVLQKFSAKRNGDTVIVKTQESLGKFKAIESAVVKLITDNGVVTGSGNIISGVEIKL